ncbi:hypothetical protein [Hyphomonas sp.]|uniref:hypothetical protein n=1 Tax=Hyphomonas sp. TaxID=87 RepID=UPI003F721BDB
MLLATNMGELTQRLGTQDARANLYRKESMLALIFLRDYLDILSEETGIPDLSRPILPMSQALLDLETTGATPKMFDKKAMSRPPATVSEMNRKYLCAWVQRLYRNNGMGRTDASKRLRGVLLHVLPVGEKLPSQRSLEDWFDNTGPQGKWLEDYNRIFAAELTDAKNVRGLSNAQIDEIAKISISQSIHNF